jgi:predicted alpha/beta-fold hydrolase
MVETYSPPFFLFSPHLETIFPAVTRRVKIRPYDRERIETPDNDFLDLDWLKNNSKKLVIISHGLEGNTSRAYMKGMAKIFHSQGYNVLAWNYRGCSEEMNRQIRFYHSGATDDLNTVVMHAIARGYDEINLIGFSLGGNMTLKYLGEGKVPPEIKTAATISVPMDLGSSCRKISQPANWIYSNRFLKSLKNKILTKASIRNDIDISGIKNVNTLEQFDNRFTAPLHGFENANDYYSRCSAIRFVHDINIPTLIINATNDPFLSKECFPIEKLQNHPFVKLDVLTRGGHVGFSQINKNGSYWSEQRALDFIHHGRH